VLAVLALATMGAIQLGREYVHAANVRPLTDNWTSKQLKAGIPAEVYDKYTLEERRVAWKRYERLLIEALSDEPIHTDPLPEGPK
jgi:hypothetical protein